MQSKVEREAAAKHELQKRIDEKDSAAESLVKECSSLEQASSGCCLVFRNIILGQKRCVLLSAESYVNMDPLYDPG